MYRMAARRKKIYYPENQIRRDLFTRGQEWMTLDDWKEYTGFYHQYSTGETFTERDWDANRSRKLVRYQDRSDTYFKYLDLMHYTQISGQKEVILTSGLVQFSKYHAPRAVRVSPSETDKKVGVMNRYFIYKRNEPERVFFEIDASQRSSHSGDRTGINQYLYGVVDIPWKLSGPEFDQYQNGLLVTPGVVDTNQRIIDRFSKKFPILKTILLNPREFTKYDK